MLRGAALAVALLLSGGTVASATPAPITEIGLADCHMGNETGTSPLVAFVLTPDGRILRATAPNGRRTSVILPERMDAVFATTDIGAAAYQAIARQIETSPFFELSHGDRAQFVTDTRGTRVSAVRESRRMTWASDAYPTDRRTTIMAVYRAVFDTVKDSQLTWVPATTTTDPFALCSEPVQRDPFGR